jgi:hypothetical protein
MNMNTNQNEKMSVNISKIKQLKYRYGDFSELKNKWGFIFQRLLNKKEIVKAIIDMKDAEIITLKKRKENVTDKKELKVLNKLLDEVFEEKKHFEWVLNNFNEYKRL